MVLIFGYMVFCREYFLWILIIECDIRIFDGSWVTMSVWLRFGGVCVGVVFWVSELLCLYYCCFLVFLSCYVCIGGVCNSCVF